MQHLGACDAWSLYLASCTYCALSRACLSWQAVMQSTLSVREGREWTAESLEPELVTFPRPTSQLSIRAFAKLPLHSPGQGYATTSSGRAPSMLPLTLAPFELPPNLVTARCSA